MPAKKIQDIPIRSVAQLISSLEDTSADALRLFRGQNTDQCLLPRIIRLAKENKISPAKIDSVEQRMLERFRKECVPMLLTTKQLAAWELVSIAQHNGMPTRLLDWTSNPLAGLWFAVASDPPKKKDRGVVWMLDRPNERTFEHDDNIFALEKTCFFQPPHLDRRIAAQSAWFSVYRHNKTDFLPLEKQIRYADKVTRFVIQPNNFQPIRQQLRRLGINHATFFPDLSGLGADIQLEFIDATRRLDTV
jgi:hypothetical protein